MYASLPAAFCPLDWDAGYRGCDMVTRYINAALPLAFARLLDDASVGIALQTGTRRPVGVEAIYWGVL